MAIPYLDQHPTNMWCQCGACFRYISGDMKARRFKPLTHKYKISIQLGQHGSVATSSPSMLEAVGSSQSQFLALLIITYNLRKCTGDGASTLTHGYTVIQSPKERNPENFKRKKLKKYIQDFHTLVMHGRPISSSMMHNAAVKSTFLVLRKSNSSMKALVQH